MQAPMAYSPSAEEGATSWLLWAVRSSSSPPMVLSLLLLALAFCFYLRFGLLPLLHAEENGQGSRRGPLPRSRPKNERFHYELCGSPRTLLLAERQKNDDNIVDVS